MGFLEIFSAIILVIACVFIVLVVLMQDTQQGMSQTISGGSADNYYQRNSGRSNEAKLARLTKIAAVVFFVAALVVNFVVMYSGNFAAATNTSSTTSTSSTATPGDTADVSETESTTDSSDAAESAASTDSSDTTSQE